MIAVDLIVETFVDTNIAAKCIIIVHKYSQPLTFSGETDSFPHLEIHLPKILYVDQSKAFAQTSQGFNVKYKKGLKKGGGI